MPSADPSSFPLDRPTPVPDALFRQIYGGSTICCMLMLVLYGVSILQTYLYYMNYPDDRRAMKVLVALLFCVATLHAIFLCHAQYHYVVLTYHDPVLLLGGEWTLYMVTGTGVIISTLVQLFYTRTIYYLTKNKLRWSLTIVLVLLILMQFAFGIRTVVGEYREWDIAKLANISLNSMVPMWAARVASDSVTAVSLCILLHGARPRFSGSGKLVHTLIIFAINRFLLTTVTVIVQVIALICSPSSIWAMIIDFVSVHLYVNSCLATLNSRHHLRNMSQNSAQDVSGPLSTGMIRFDNGTMGSRPAVTVELNATRASDVTGIEMNEYAIDNKSADHNVTSAV